MTRTQSAILLAAVVGAIDGWFSTLNPTSDGQRLLLILVPTVLGLAVLFWWLHEDSPRHNFRRSPLLNIGIVAIAIVFVPIYFVRSRQPGARLRAVAGFMGVLGLYFLAALATTALIDMADVLPQ